MKENEFVSLLVIKSKIYDPDLPTKVREALEQDIELGLVEIDPGKKYQVDIRFDAHVYETDEEFYSFPIAKETPVLWRGKKNVPESAIKKQKIYDILSEQLASVLKVFESAGMCVPYAYISGEEHIVADRVGVFIHTCESEQEPGQKTPKAYMRSVMPSRKATNENLRKVLEMINESRQRDQQMKESEAAQHTPNLVSAEELFSEIAQSMYPFDAEKAALHKEMLYETAMLIADGPFQLKSRDKWADSAPVDKGTRLDCPEHMIYIQDTTGEWSIKKTENLSAAQEIIIKHGYNLKRTDRIIVLHNLKPVPYVLFKGTSEGLVKVTPEEARGEKKLYLSWDK